MTKLTTKQAEALTKMQSEGTNTLTAERVAELGINGRTLKGLASKGWLEIKAAGKVTLMLVEDANAEEDAAAVPDAKPPALKIVKDDEGAAEDTAAPATVATGWETNLASVGMTLTTLFDEGPMACSRLAKTLELKWSKIKHGVDTLIEKGLVGHDDDKVTLSTVLMIPAEVADINMTNADEVIAAARALGVDIEADLVDVSAAAKADKASRKVAKPERFTVEDGSVENTVKAVMAFLVFVGEATVTETIKALGTGGRQFVADRMNELAEVGAVAVEKRGPFWHFKPSETLTTDDEVMAQPFIGFRIASGSTTRVSKRSAIEAAIATMAGILAKADGLTEDDRAVLAAIGETFLA